MKTVAKLLKRLVIGIFIMTVYHACFVYLIQNAETGGYDQHSEHFSFVTSIVLAILYQFSLMFDD